METKAKYVTVGAFVVSGVLALLAIIVWLGATQHGEDFAYYQVYFTNSVTGLGKDTPVRYNGIDAGTIDKLQFDANDPKRVIVTLKVDPTLRLRNDSVASIESVGLAGGSYVEITGGSKTAPLLERQPGQEYPVIRSKPSTLQQLAEIVPALVSRLTVVSNRFNDLLNDDNRRAVAETLAHLDVATDQLNHTLVAVDHTTRSIGRLSDDTDKLSNDADNVVRNSQAQINQSIVQIHALAAETRGMVASITRLSNDIDRQPTKILFGDRREGYTPK